MGSFVRRIRNKPIILKFSIHVICDLCNVIQVKKKNYFENSFIHQKRMSNNNSFSSLENINILIKSLINSNKYALPLKHISKLVDDLTNLFNESDHYDMEIEIGENDNIKIFKAHSNILKSRSSYFKAALSGDWIKKAENGIILFEKKNISPRIFEVLLMYVYN